jgi:hypothetical protein
MSRQTDANATVEGWIQEDRGSGQVEGGEVEELERLYSIPAATFGEVEEAEDEIAWFVVLVVFLLTLAATLGAAAVVFCWIKGGHLHTWYRLSAFKVRIGCKF